MLNFEHFENVHPGRPADFQMRHCYLPLAPLTHYF